MSQGWKELFRERRLSEGLRLYARLLIEHERVRRLAGRGARACLAHSPAFRAVHEVAFFCGADRRAAPLRSFCSAWPDKEDALPSVGAEPYLAALAAALGLAGDGIVVGGAEPPWGFGKPEARCQARWRSRQTRPGDRPAAQSHQRQTPHRHCPGSMTGRTWQR